MDSNGDEWSHTSVGSFAAEWVGNMTKTRQKRMQLARSRAGYHHPGRAISGLSHSQRLLSTCMLWGCTARRSSLTKETRGGSDRPETCIVLQNEGPLKSCHMEMPYVGVFCPCKLCARQLDVCGNHGGWVQCAAVGYLICMQEWRSLKGQTKSF